MTTHQAALTLLFDGACPLCVREVRFLRQRDRAGQIVFVDVNAQDYAPEQWGGIHYRQAMARIHAIRADGSVLTDVAVFREAYRLVGLGWLYAPTTWPLIGALVDRLYSFWASNRLRLTGRADLDTLCSKRCQLGAEPVKILLREGAGGDG
ncbi:MAG: thiol-disulfide oxidoreductase DCC family protein [Synechococcus sp.]